MSDGVPRISSLRKANLVSLAQKYGIEPEGTRDDLRDRLKTHLRKMEAAKSVPEPDAPDHVMGRIRQWGVHYDGGKGADEFLARLTDLQISYGVRPEHILPRLTEVFRGQAPQ